MINQELVDVVQGYERYIEENGVDDTVIDAYIEAATTALIREQKRRYGLTLTARCKELLEQRVKQLTGGTMWDLEKYCFANKTNYEILEKYYSVLLMEAQNRVLDSYFQYLEKKREPQERFYMPKRKQLLRIGLIDQLQDMLEDKADILCISMPPGSGKAQPLYSKILTPNGFVRMGDVRVGTEVISGRGNVCKVTGVYPQGKRSIYEVVFNDGSKCRCSDEHLWTVQTIEDRNRGKYRTIETKDMLSNFKRNHQNNYSVDYVPKIEFDKKDFLIHPYLMGVLIADGCFTRKNVSFATMDKEVVERIKKVLPENAEVVQYAKCNYGIKSNDGGGRGHKTAIRTALESYGLFGKYSKDKFIPHDYMTSSFDDRMELLMGLLDSDGTIGKRGYDISYCSTSERLAKDVVELVHSLGAYASVYKKPVRYRDDRGSVHECGESYNVCIEFVRGDYVPFCIERKARRFRPKNRGLKRFISDIKYIGEEECQCIMIDDPCHLYVTDDYIITHNTTLSKFFLSGVIGWFPRDFNLFFSHSGDIARMYYDGELDILSNAEEYTWREVFPQLYVKSTNAKAQQLNVGKYKPFPSLQCTSRGSNNAGVVRASKFLMVDDLIAGIEEALNKNILDKLWNIYSVDARQRKIDGCKEIHIATRWSVHDVIGRLQREYEGNERVRFISVPDIDPETGKSNFDYEFNGFTVEFFEDQERLMDDISYRCLYKQEPIEREGLLYHEDELRRYLTLPNREPDAVLGVCDTKSKGTDFMFLPCVYQYDKDYYLVDCVFDDNADFGVQEERCTDLIMQHNMQQCQFESNVGGDRFAENVAKRVKDLGGRCNITTKPTETNKETKIFVNADWVKKNILFPDKSMYAPKSDIGRMMSQLMSYSVSGKVPHDDAADGWAMFALYVTADRSYSRVEAIVNPFRYGGSVYGY